MPCRLRPLALVVTALGLTLAVVGHAGAATPVTNCPSSWVQGSVGPLDSEPDFGNPPLTVLAGERVAIAVRCKYADGTPRRRDAFCVAGPPAYGTHCWGYVVGTDAWRERVFRFRIAGAYRISFRTALGGRVAFSEGLRVTR